MPYEPTHQEAAAECDSSPAITDVGPQHVGLREGAYLQAQRASRLRESQGVSGRLTVKLSNKLSATAEPSGCRTDQIVGLRSRCSPQGADLPGLILVSATFDTAPDHSSRKSAPVADALP